jgi:hypothetical protein
VSLDAAATAGSAVAGQRGLSVQLYLDTRRPSDGELVDSAGLNFAFSSASASQQPLSAASAVDRLHSMEIEVAMDAQQQKDEEEEDSADGQSDPLEGSGDEDESQHDDEEDPVDESGSEDLSAEEDASADASDSGHSSTLSPALTAFTMNAAGVRGSRSGPGAVSVVSVPATLSAHVAGPAPPSVTPPPPAASGESAPIPSHASAAVAAAALEQLQ